MLPVLVAPFQVLAQLHAEGLNAKIVDAIDGDAFTSQASTTTLPGVSFGRFRTCASTA